MITIRLYLPGCTSEDAGAFALSDGEAISLPALYYDQCDQNVVVPISNEIAFDAFRLAIAEGKIPHDKIRWRTYDADGVVRGTFSRFGVPMDATGTKQHHIYSPHNNTVEKILMTAVQKKKREQLENIREASPCVIPLPVLDPTPEQNCKGKEHDDQSPTND